MSILFRRISGKSGRDENQLNIRRQGLRVIRQGMSPNSRYVARTRCSELMNLATLRVEGADGALASLIKLMSFECDVQWKKGDKKRNGSAHASSGFNSTIADARSPGELIVLIHSFLAQCKEKNIVFPSMGLSAELAVGFTVGGSEQFVAGVEFAPPELLVCAECGITLSVTAYPTSDEANAEDNAT